MVSDGMAGTAKIMTARVLILVVMEYGLGLARHQLHKDLKEMS